MRTFDPLTIPLNGQQLIEASAGTGKTYSIALLYLRLIVEGSLNIDEILVVTFTTSATEELRQRIRSRLREALDILERSGDEDMQGGDKVLSGLLSSLANRQEAIQKLTDSLARMDESAVFTIHSFCQRILQEHAFESGAPFEAELIESEQQLRREIIRDFWRQRFYSASEAETTWATAVWGDPADLANILTSLLARSEVTCIPEVAAAELDRLRVECERCYIDVLRCWQENSQQIIHILRNDSCLSRDNSSGYGLHRLETVLLELEKILSAGSFPWLLPKGVELFAASVMAGKLKGKKIAPVHEFFILFDEFREKNILFTRLSGIQVVRSAYQYLCTELELRKRNRGQMYFDDLLTRLDRALAGPNGHKLVKRIRNCFAVALVDEFQDTDPLQYRIFHILFGQGAKPGLFMIGDPKQSIYSFRGADVFAYIRAKKDTDSTAAFTMDTNYRSTEAMVKGVNRLFDSQASFIFEEDIPFHPVQSGGSADDKPLIVEGSVPEPFQAMILPVEGLAAGNRNAISKERAANAASRWTALEITRLLHLGSRGKAVIGDRPLAGGDIAVLVRTHREAEMIQQDLSRQRINSVYYSQDSVFLSEEAWELQLVLAALLDLSAAARVNSALATGLFGMDAHALEMLHSDADKWDEMIATLEGYHVLWRSHGVAAMLQKMVTEQKVVTRQIVQSGGERKLTNYLHLAELLQRASEQQAGMEGLVRWLSIQRQSPEEANASQQLRLESDENLVRIVTVHKAKGLEYPVVFLPFVWHCRVVKDDDFLSFHQPETLEHVIDLGTGEPENQILAERERLAEDLRLLYVAVTRAQHCCYFNWGRVSSMEKTAMAWLLHRVDAFQRPAPARLTEEQILQDLSCLNDREKLLQFHALPREDEEPPAVPVEKPGVTLEAGKFNGRIDTNWAINSYSRLVSSTAHTALAGRIEHTPSAAIDSMAERNVFTFPRGPAAGTCLHNIFEQLDFPAYSKNSQQGLVEDELRRSGLDTDWTPVVCSWVEDVLKTSLDAGSGLQLKALGENDRLMEMGFYFSMQDLDVSRLNKLLTNFDFRPVELRSVGLTGLMRGYIDLVFHYQGKYYLADYKSNHLGSTPADYRGAALEEAMQEHRYDLQYLIYTVALHRYLGNRIRGYDYSLHFGGVFYLFLRGMHPDHSSADGIYNSVPARELIEGLDACFGLREEM